MTTVGAAPTTDLFGRSGELPLMCGFTPTPPGLRPSGASIANLAGGLSYFTRHAGHLFAFWNLILSQALFSGAANLRRCVCPVVVAAFWAAKCHTPSAFHLSVTQRSLKTTSVFAHVRNLSLCAITLANKARMFFGTTLGFMDRSLVGREAGTTRCSPATDVPRFRASKPPFFPRRTAFPIRPRPWGP